MRGRSLSEEGLSLFNVAYEAKPSRSKIKKFLSCIFCTKDDKLIEEIEKQCRKSSEHLLANLTNKNMSAWVDRFVQNLLVLILKDNEKIAKYHIAKKNYYVYLNVAKRALANDDHNTAWLMYVAFLNKSIQDLNFKKGSTFIKTCRSKYGNTNNCFQNHAINVSNVHSTENCIKSRKYLPVAAILNMYSKKMHAYHKTYEDLGLKQSDKNRLLQIENAVQKYQEHYKEIQSGRLMPLYLEDLKLPGFEDKEKIAFGDLLEVSRTIKKNKHRKKRNRVEPAPIPTLKRTKKTWTYNPNYGKTLPVTI